MLELCYNLLQLGWAFYYPFGFGLDISIFQAFWYWDLEHVGVFFIPDCVRIFLV